MVAIRNRNITSRHMLLKINFCNTHYGEFLEGIGREASNPLHTLPELIWYPGVYWLTDAFVAALEALTCSFPVAR